MCNLRHKTENKGSCEEYCYKAVKSGKHIELYIYKDKNFKRKTKETNDLMKIINDWDITENEKKDKKEDTSSRIRVTTDGKHIIQTGSIIVTPDGKHETVVSDLGGIIITGSGEHIHVH